MTTSSRTTRRSKNESDARLSAIVGGPWSKKGRLATRYFKPLEPPREIIRNWRQATGGKQDFGTGRVKDVEIWSCILRDHATRKIDDQDDRRLRESLDHALFALELLELSIQSGYLSLDGVRKSAQETIATLLWHSSVREYLSTYNYDLVKYLALRVGLPVDSDCMSSRLPSERHDEDIRFIEFLSITKAMYENEFVESWKARLDDYLYPKLEDHWSFWKYLKLGKRATSKSVLLSKHRERAVGMFIFLLEYGSFFRTLNRDQWPLYGSAIRYWLDRFFGYERSVTGRKARRNAEKDWSDYDYLLGRGIFGVDRTIGAYLMDDREELKRELRKNVGVLRKVLQATHQRLFV